MPGSSSWMPYAPQRVKGFDDILCARGLLETVPYLDSLIKIINPGTQLKQPACPRRDNQWRCRRNESGTVLVSMTPKIEAASSSETSVND